jgi:hypothetical protein
LLAVSCIAWLDLLRGDDDERRSDRYDGKADANRVKEEWKPQTRIMPTGR